jgi:arginine N-succinyltransferase
MLSMFVRPIAHKDLDTLYEIAVESGPGFTSLMPDRDALARKIEHSIDSFRRTTSQPGDEHYLFVLEDEATGAVMGTTGIEASAGHTRPLHHFRHNTVVRHSRDLGLRRSVETLTRCNHYTGCTEICSLYLRPQFRRANAGKLLSRVRFVFMATHPERFSGTVIAEMRGVSDDAGQSPFWNWIKAHFVDMEFAKATSLMGAGYTDFINELMPLHPLYTSLLSNEARSVIGQVHPQTRPALHMLETEGFRYRGLVDLLDAGPTVECPLASIRSVRNSALYELATASSGETGFSMRTHEPARVPLLIANTETSGFRATIAEGAHARVNGNRLTLPASFAGLQRSGINNQVRALPLNGPHQFNSDNPEQTQPEIHYAH